MAIAPAAIMAGGSVVGSILGGKGQQKAAKDSAKIVSADNASNRAFATDIYNRNVGYLSPWQTSGATANNAIMELLGFPAAQAAPAFPGYGASGAYSTPGFNPQMSGGPAYGPAFNSDGPYAGDPGMSGMAGMQVGGGAFGAPPQDGVTTTAPSARSAFDTYRGSTGYDFRFNEGVRGLQAAFSRNLDSGAAQKAAIRYGQGVGSDEFARYMQLLGQQSQLGFGAGSAIAGVGQNFTNTVTAGNQSAASAAANARLYAGNASANMWQGIGSSFGNAMGAFKW